MQCPPRKETRSPSGRCAHRAASSRMYCRPEKREGLKKTRATTSSAFWAAGNRRSGACAGSRLHRLREPHETQRSYHRILSILTLYRLSPIILNEHTLRSAKKLLQVVAVLNEEMWPTRTRSCSAPLSEAGSGFVVAGL